MKMGFKKLIILNLLFSFCSCKSYYERTTSDFFAGWEKESSEMIIEEPENPLEKSILEISSLVNCHKLIENENRPKLKYKIINKDIKVSLVMDLDCPEFKKFPAPFSLKTPKYIFKDSLFFNRTSCSQSEQKILILTDYYKKKVYGRLKYGFGSSNRGKKLKTARAILESHGKNYYRIPEETSKMTFNKTQDSVVIDISKTYSLTRKRFVKLNNKWVFDKILLEFVE